MILFFPLSFGFITIIVVRSIYVRGNKFNCTRGEMKNNDFQNLSTGPCRLRSVYNNNSNNNNKIIIMRAAGCGCVWFFLFISSSDTETDSHSFAE